MLTKQAQEEIYNSYYNQGVDLALGQIKEAGLAKDTIKEMIRLPAAGVAAAGGVPSMKFIVNSLMDMQNASPEMLALANYLSAAGIGAGAVGAYQGTGKVVDGIANFASGYDRMIRNQKMLDSIPGFKSLRKALGKRSNAKLFKDKPIRKFLVDSTL
tara:strand:+ start:12609 stop:13079 length:471 start_codon:yes stop_codon:yes gene_type:complete